MRGGIEDDAIAVVKLLLAVQSRYYCRNLDWEELKESTWS